MLFNRLLFVTLLLLQKSAYSLKFLNPSNETNSTCPAEHIAKLNLRFSETLGDQIAFAQGLCLDRKYAPIIRRCYKNGTWEVLKNTRCLDQALLVNLTIQQVPEKTPEEALKWFNDNQGVELKAIDAFFFTTSFHKVLGGNTDGAFIFETMKNLLDIDVDVFDKALYSFDLLLEDLEKIILGEVPVNATLTEMKNPTVLQVTLDENISVVVAEGKIFAVEKSYGGNFDIAFNFPKDFLQSQPTVSFAVINKSFESFFSPLFGVFISDLALQSKEVVVDIYFRRDLNGIPTSIDGHLKNGPFCIHLEYPTDIDNIHGKLIFDSKAITSDGLYKCSMTLSNTWKGLLKVNPSEPSAKNFCPEEKFHNLTFPKTEAGVVTSPRELCLQENYRPVVRKCLENGTWADTSGKCTKNVDGISNVTSQLHDALNFPPKEALSILYNISKKPQEFKAVDVDFAAKILNIPQNMTEMSELLIGAVSNVMEVPKEVLAESQEILNSTDRILYTFDRFLLNSGGMIANFSNILVESVQNFKEIDGIVIANGKVEHIRNETDLNQMDFDVALMVVNKNKIGDEKYHVHLTWFKNDQFFNSIEKNQKASSSVLSILLPETFRNVGIRIYFKETSTEPNNCSFWKYGYENKKPIKGNWKSEGISHEFRENYYYCEFNHTTHFGLVLIDNLRENVVLDLITITGSVLSLLGISVLFLTGITFRKWRQNPSHKILLNVTCCYFLLIVTFYASDFMQQGPFCIFIGILLHYLCVAHFLWTLVISLCTYRNLVLIFRTAVDNAVLKYAIFCWATPLLIIIITISWSNWQTYDKSSSDSTNELCYPKGPYLIYTVLLPIGIILSVNLIVYFKIIHSITRKLNIGKHMISKSYAAPKSAVVFFFMMGLTWIFGVLGIFVGEFLYVFCFLATFQGFIIVVFYIFGAKDTRNLWKNKLHFGRKANEVGKVGKTIETNGLDKNSATTTDTN